MSKDNKHTQGSPGDFEDKIDSAMAGLEADLDEEFHGADFYDEDDQESDFDSWEGEDDSDAEELAEQDSEEEYPEEEEYDQDEAELSTEEEDFWDEEETESEEEDSEEESDTEENGNEVQNQETEQDKSQNEDGDETSDAESEETESGQEDIYTAPENKNHVNISFQFTNASGTKPVYPVNLVLKEVDTGAKEKITVRSSGQIVELEHGDYQVVSMKDGGTMPLVASNQTMSIYKNARYTIQFQQNRAKKMFFDFLKDNILLIVVFIGAAAIYNATIIKNFNKHPRR